MNSLSYLFLHMAAVATGFCLDLLIGDPRFLVHPVCLMGRLVAFLERHWNRGGARLQKGILLAAVLPAVSVAVPTGLLWLAFCIHPLCGFVLESFWCGQLLACRDLKVESMAVWEALRADDLVLARKRVARIVGRDTEMLDEAGVIRAAVETVAENTSDGVIAPLFYMAFFGCAGGFFYKAVNTMDSMVGYKNERYLLFGRAAAKLDDIMNFIPARLAGLLMVAAAAFTGMDSAGAWRIFGRDRLCHASPNSAQTEAACAGALGVQLAGNASYFGKVTEKPTIGDESRPVENADIQRANRLLYASAVLMMFAVLVFWAVCLVIRCRVC